MAAVDLLTIERLCRPGREPILTPEQAIHSLHAFGPRCRFIKTLPLGSRVLDVGAGDGSLQVFRSWPDPARPDLRMFAWADTEGASFNRFERFEVGLWPEKPPAFDGRQFDAILAANFIEHIDDPITFIAWAISRLAPQGRLFLEWPRAESAFLPTTAELATAGLPIMTGNYFDDDTHRSAIPDVIAVTAAITGAGLRLRESGIASVPFVDQEVAIHAARSQDIVNLTLAYWSMTGWCQYLFAER
jgi:SAM-dependent methyltransferase